jgi:hypothetical protein
MKDRTRRDVPSGHLPDPFDRLLGALDGLPDVVKTKAATIRTMPLLGVGGSTLHVVQTVRQQLTRVSKAGVEVGYSQDTIFLEVVRGENDNIKLVIPPEVADAIARQRDALAGKTRSKAARKLAAERKAAGVVPGFLRKVAR